MAEYIEREAAIEKTEAFCDVFVTKWTDEKVIAWIRKLPAADVVEVRHGRWEFDGSDFADIWKCSACGDDWFFEYDPRDAETLVRFCPNCGARMVGEG